MLELVSLGSHESYRTMTKITESTSIKKGRVAIIGSSPAGLFTAWALRNDRYAVTIFEKAGV